MEIDSKSLVKVIKACRASHVSYLKLGELELKFGPDEAAQTPATKSETFVVPTDAELKVLEEAAAIRQNGSDADDELAYMLLDDPVQYEELLANRELESGGGEEATA